MRTFFSAISSGIAAASSSALASQGPGVGAGTAGPFAQLAVSGFIGVMIAFCAFALIKVLRSGLR